MTDDQARADIAAIRAALDQGRAYATARSPDMMVWGCLIAAGYLGTWASVTGNLPIEPNWLWLGILAVGWPVYIVLRLSGRKPDTPRPAIMALRMTWLGIGIALTVTSLIGNFGRHLGMGWFDPFGAAMLGAGFFASATLCGLPWLRWVALAWWVGEIGTFWLLGNVMSLPFSAALYLLLFAGPGLVLYLRPRAA